MDTASDERFDRLTRLAQQLFDAPIALITLVDARRQWFKSAQGLSVSETGRDISFCGHTILSDDILEIQDARLDERFANNPLVVAAPNIRFYAGAPLHSDDRMRVGTLCIADYKPRQLTEPQRKALRDLANCVETEIIEHRRRHQQDALVTLTRITTLHNDDIRELLREALTIGCAYLGLPIGIISSIEAEDYEVLVQVSPPGVLEDGARFELGKTYCSITLQSGDVLPVTHMRKSRHAGHPCYQEFGLESYIGVPLYMHGKSCGTLNFSSSEPREPRDFTGAELEFMRLFGDWVSSRLQQWQLDRVVDLHRRLSLAISRAQSEFIRQPDRNKAFESLLTDILKLTNSDYGFIGEVLTGAGGDLYLKTYAITDISWNDETRRFYQDNAPLGLEFHNLKTLFGSVLTSREAVIANDPANDPRRGGLPEGHPPLTAFLGLPIYHNTEMVAMLGIANRPGGYDDSIVSFLAPMLTTIGQIVDAANTQKQLQESEDSYRNLFELSEDANMTLDEAGFIDCNQATLAMFGASSKADFLGKHPSEISPEFQPDGRDSLSAADEKIATAFSKGHNLFEWLHQRTNGEVFPAEVLLTPMMLGGRNLLQAVVRDITERKRTEKALHESTAQLRSIIMAVPMVLWMLDKDGRFLMSEGRGLKDLGLTPGQVVGQSVFDVYADFPELLNTVKRALRGETLFLDQDVVDRTYETHYQPWIDQDGEFRGTIGVAMDITERKHAEAALRESESRLSFLLLSSPTVIYTCDATPPFGATFISANAHRLMGYSPEEFTGDPGFWADHIHPDDAPRVFENLPQLFEHGHHNHEYRFRMPDGSYRWFYDDLRLIVDLNGDPVEIVGSWIDISDRKRVEQIKKEFISTASHELRTPLTSIVAALGLISGDYLGDLPPQVREMVAIARKNSQRLSTLINELLDIEKLEAGKMAMNFKVQPLMQIVDQAVHDNQPYAEQYNVRFLADGRVDDINVSVDEQRLLQVLTNLLSNAAKFSPPGGVVRIRTSRSGGNVRIEVIDKGPGISDEFRNRVFEKFAQADATNTRNSGGTGLGLAISRELIEQMEGRIGFESAAERGSTFYFELPVSNTPV
ncbi:MAG: PAS domain S-box protein [Gammaproteobacteria bacterium]|nr:PAS domain S-box protein [Gammaproteobacteria bacterium]